MSAVGIGLVGCGLVARRAHFPAFGADPNAEVVAVASGRRASAEAAAAEFGVARIHDRWEDLVDDPDVDAVDICATNALHHPIAVAAARAGKHVLVEKPMATTITEADEMIAAADAAGVTLAVAHNLRALPVFEQVHDTVASGAIGDVVAARGVFGHSGPDESWGATSDWFWDERAGGGALLDLGVHIIDLLRWFVGAEVREVAAFTGRTSKPTAFDDQAFVLMRFDGDVLVSAQTAWTARPPDRELAVQGTLGRVVLRLDDDDVSLVVRRPDGEASTSEAVPIPAESSIGDPYRHFVRSVRRGEQPAVDGREGRATLAVALAAYESDRTGRAVEPASLPEAIVR